MMGERHLDRSSPSASTSSAGRVLLWLVLGALVLWALAVSLPYYVRLPITFDITATDNGLFSEMARTLARGGILYRDLWDTKPLGMFILMAPFIRVMGNTSGAIAASILFMDAFFVVASAAVSYAISGGSRVAVLIGASLALLFSATLDIPETTVLMAALSATAMTLVLLGRGRWLPLIVGGAMFAFGLMTKQPLIVELPILFLFALLRAPSGSGPKLRAFLYVVVGLGLTTILFLIWSVGNGSFQPMWAHVVGTAQSYVTGTSGMWHFDGDGLSLFQDYFIGATLPLLVVFFALAAGSALIVLVKRRRDPLVWVALLWIILSFVGASIAQAFKPYYFRQMIPPLIAMIALAVPLVGRMSLQRQVVASGLVLAGAVWFGVNKVGLPPATVSPPRDVPAAMRVVDYIEQHTDPNDCLWLWGNLARFSYLSGRHSCVSPIHEGFLMNTSVFNVVPARIEWMHNLFDHPPRLHILHSPWGYFKEEQKFADRYLGPLVFSSHNDAVFSVDMSKFHRLGADFNHEIGLFGYDLPPKEAYCPGDTLKLAMTWEQLSTPQHEYQMFAKLITADETAQIAGYDGVPADDRPTNEWTDADELVLGPTFDLQIPKDAAPGTYKLTVGLYDTAAPNAQLQTLDASGQSKGYAVLQTITVACS